MLKLSKVLKIFKGHDLDVLIKEMTGFNLTEKGLTYDDISENWKFLGGSSSNGSNVNMLVKGEKGLVERVTNAVDAVIEKHKSKNNIGSVSSPDVIISKSFPKFYQNRNEVYSGKSDKIDCKDANDLVILAVNDANKSNTPTFDIIDKGTGIKGAEFGDTILSINHGNKLKRDKSYLIGAFGQGGSTALPFSYATLIVSKNNGHFYFTVIKGVELADYKNIVYVYMTIKGTIPELQNDYEDSDYLNGFTNSDSGTLVRMIEMEISKKYRDNEVTKPGMLCDYINTELFDVRLPIKIIDNRSNYESNKHTQNRYSYGTCMKLKTWSCVKQEYSGTISIIHKNNTYKIDYFVILPNDEEKWGKESDCKMQFEQFNIYTDPIIYTVNGQTITTEAYTKINNKGLNFLKYRLLIVVNLDILGSEKYRFFTSDRSQIRDTDLTKGFIDTVISGISEVEKLKEINSIIAKKSVASSVDSEMLDSISRSIKSEYNKFLKYETSINNSNGVHCTKSEEIFLDDISSLEITSTRNIFYRNDPLSFIVTTHAQKHVNASSKIYPYIDGKQSYDFQNALMNGRIQYTFSSGSIAPGPHMIQFIMYKEDGYTIIRSNVLDFKTVSEDSTSKATNKSLSSLDINIHEVSGAILICNLCRDIDKKKIDINLCLDNDLLVDTIYGTMMSDDERASVKTNIIKPIALFVLFHANFYEKMGDDDKNSLLLSLIKTLVSSERV